MEKYKEYSPFILRILISIIFLYSGFMKLINPEKTTSLLSNIGFPLPLFFAWILLISELTFGFLVLIGWKIKYTVLPLIFILIIAVITVTIPSGNISNILFHILAICVLISLLLTGPGKFSLGK